MTNNIPSSLVEWVQQLGLEDQFNLQQIESGRVVGKIFKIVYPQYNLQLLASNTAVNRVSNWNNLITQLKKINIKVSQDEKTKIINGNHDLVYQILSKMHEYYTKNQKQTQVDLSKINPKSDISQSSSLLELFILTIMKYFNLNPKQSVALLSNECKYLAHILVKGLKGEMKPVEAFISQLTKNIGLISGFCKNRQNQIFFIRAIKPTLISKSEIACDKGMRLLQQFLTPLSNKYQIVKQHFLSTIVLAIRRHPHLIQQILKFTIKTTEYSKDLLTLFKTQANQMELQNIFLALFNISKETSQIRRLYELKGVNDIISKSVQNIKNSDMSISSLNLLLIISSQSTELLSDPERGSKFIENIQEIAMSKKAENLVFIEQLFTFLYIFGKDKNQLAPAIFKILIAKYQSALNSEESKVYIQNFVEIILQFPTIPISMIVEAINSRIESNTLNCSQVELNLLRIAIDNENIELKTVLVIYNTVSKLLVQEPAYAGLCSEILLSIVRKFHSETIILDLTNKLIKVCLAIHFANSKRLTSKRKSVTGATKIQLQDAIFKAKNIAMEDFIYKIVEQRNEQINKSSEPLICYSLIQVESLSKQSGSGLKRIVELFGNPTDILKKYELEARKLEQEQHRKDQVKKSKLKQSAWGTGHNSRHRNDADATSNLFENKQRSSSHRSSDEGIKSIKSSKLKSKLDPMLFSHAGVANVAIKGLEKYQKSYLSKIEKIQQEQIKRKEQEERQNYLKKIFERKLIQKGIDVKKAKDQQFKYLYQFGVKQKQLELDTVKHSVQFAYYVPEYEQQRDIKGLQFTIRKYQKILKLYYSLYSGHNKPQNLDSFDQMAQKFNLLYSVNLIKMFKDHMLDEFISMREVHYLSKQINVSLGKKYQDATALDYEGFEQFIIQASFTMFTRPPKDLRGRPVSEMIEETISRFKLYASDNKINEKLFEDPDTFFYNETEAIKQLNKKLENNPDYILPEGYKKITEKKVLFTHRIFLDAMSEQYKDVYQIIDEILNKCLGIHIIEPFSTYQTVAKARPTLYSTKQRADGDVASERLSAFIKKQVAKMPIKDRQIGKQVAGVIDEIVEAVEFGHDRIGLKRENKLIKQKKLLQQQQTKKQIQDRKKWAERNREIKSALVKHKEIAQEKERQQKQRKAQQKRKQQQEKRRKQQEDRRLKQKVQSYQSKKKEDQERRKKQQAEQKRKEKEEMERKKKESQELRKKIQETRLKKEEQEKQKKQAEQTAQKQRKANEKKKQEEEQRKKKEMIEQYKNKKSQIIQSGPNNSSLLQKVQKEVNKALDSSGSKVKVSLEKKK